MTLIQEIKDLVRSIMNKPPSVVRIILKIGLILFGILFWVGMFQLLWEETTSVSDTAKQLRRCDDLYYAKDYKGLREELSLFNLENEVFDKHWELISGYNDYLQYVQYTKAVAAGHEESKERVEQYRQKIQDNVSNCKFEDNKNLLNDFVEQMEED